MRGRLVRREGAYRIAFDGAALPEMREYDFDQGYGNQRR
jgi:hypothetical protein